MKEQALAVQRMQDYIEKNQTEEISLSDLAQASLFSPWYSYRLFRDCLGLTPTEYIRKYRLTQAAKQLRSGDVKVIDAAMDAGFTNVDTFTRAFYREFGLNPSDYMKNPVPITFFIPYGAKYRELRKENIDVSNIQPIFIQVVRKPERLCIIKRGRQAADYFPYDDEERVSRHRRGQYTDSNLCHARSYRTLYRSLRALLPVGIKNALQNFRVLQGVLLSNILERHSFGESISNPFLYILNRR